MYFDSFGIEYVPQNVLNKIKDEYMEYFKTYLEYNQMILLCIDFTEHMILGKTLLD